MKGERIGHFKATFDSEISVITSFCKPFRHRRSIEGLKLEKEEHLQSYRRARSLSPSKRPRSVSKEATSKAGTPSRRKEYLQQLRQEVIDSTR